MAGELKRFEIKLKVFDTGHLVEERVENLNDFKLTVFDRGRLLVVRVGN